MWGSLKKRLFGGEKNSTSAVSRRSSRELDDDRFPRESRTVGQTEARLRAANKEAWTTSTKGWSEILGRFSSKSK